MVIEFSYQGKSGDGKHHFKPTVDKEWAEQPQPVVPQVFERQLEDVSPADAAEVNLLRRPVRSAAQRQELCVKRSHSGTVDDRFQEKTQWALCSGGNLTIIMARKAKPMRTFSTLMSSMEPGSFFSTVVLKPGIMPVMFAPAEHKPTTMKQGAQSGGNRMKTTKQLHSEHVRTHCTDKSST